VGVKRGLILPQFEQDQLVGIGGALEYLELFASGILPRDLTARLHRLREFGAFAGRRVERDDEPNRHSLSSCFPICIDQYHDLPAAASSAPRNGEEAHRTSSSEWCRKTLSNEWGKIPIGSHAILCVVAAQPVSPAFAISRSKNHLHHIDFIKTMFCDNGFDREMSVTYLGLSAPGYTRGAAAE
jgi:hypothetical protein